MEAAPACTVVGVSLAVFMYGVCVGRGTHVGWLLLKVAHAARHGGCATEPAVPHGGKQMAGVSTQQLAVVAVGISCLARI